jgi:predicted MPP superfamily phosphohydrolase
MIQTIILILGAVGHVILWVALVNRAHGLGIRRQWVNWMTLACIFMCAVMPLVVLAAIVSVHAAAPTIFATIFYAAACTYVGACALVCLVAAIQRLQWRFHAERKDVVTSNHTTHINLANQLAEPLTSPGVATWLSRLPGNQILKVCVQEKQVAIPRLLPQQEGLRIVHLSDLHMSGRMTRAFYEYIVAETNRCEADIIAITGDIVDRHECLDWIPAVLGQLHAPCGVFYVLGNHDRRVNRDRLESALAKTCWRHVGGAPIHLNVRNLDLVLGGNERPWLGTPTDFAAIPPRRSDGLPLRIALSHSPDQVGWARANDVDLLLAGHVHGGQVCLPVLGPFTAPSLHGVRYAAGAFRLGDTVLHVSRGTASLTPFRWNCPPEIAVLNLRASSS